MKTTVLKFFTLSAAIFAFSTISFGQNLTTTSDATSAGARIIKPLTISVGTNLEFGDILVGSNEVTISTASERSATNTTLLLDLTSGGRTPQASTFNVQGEASLSYLITFAVVEDLTNGTDTMTLSNFTENAGGLNDGKGTIGAGGTDSFKVGATLTVANNQKAGVYEGSYTVTVAYE
jgi:hypothetical protein